MGKVRDEARTKAAEELYARLKPLQEAKGFFFNSDHSATLDILDALLGLKKRYGYMACPCRLSTGVREIDKDICCPCEYRADDVHEYDFCYCGLYTSAEALKAGQKRRPVPERRPVARTLASL
ncbi:MAG: ferredoxin:thioredoxin reductase [Deltaproteobacteria bacterium]|nr:ferredoxin:thioredoxin reductase [Deltaproteobacteria bacterium]